VELALSPWRYEGVEPEVLEEAGCEGEGEDMSLEASYDPYPPDAGAP